MFQNRKDGRQEEAGCVKTAENQSRGSQETHW